MKAKKLRNVSTQTVSIHADYDQAFDYLSNPMNQKEWAINFIRDVRQTDEGFIAVTPFGEAPLAFFCDKQTGVIDILIGGGEPIPTRLIKNQTGCEYVFTLFQPQGMPEPAWEHEAIPGLIEELQTLKSILEKGGTK
ncbi:MAG: hypothetical protein D6730_05860 [Bacteroidetes bacterium]|nr:MAG: hypothetical protein D6730_05860 [Bacteroidota bacterium]